MISKQHIQAVIDGQVVDSVPVFPVIDNYHAPMATGKDPKACERDNSLMVDAILDALKLYCYDGVVATFTPPPVFAGSAFHNDIDEIRMPDLISSNRLQGMTRILQQVGETHFVTVPIRAPFEMASLVRGLTDFYIDLKRDPNYALKLIERCLEITLGIGDTLIQSGVHSLTLKDSVASTSLISPEDYRRFVWPFERAAIEHFQKHVPVILHICKNSQPILEDMVRTGARVLEIDSLVDLSHARDQVRGRSVIKGNIDGIDILERGTAAEIEHVVTQAIKIMKGFPFILSSGDSVSAIAARQNICAMVDTARRIRD